VSDSFSFTIPAIPIAQPRPRAVAVNGRARVFGAPKAHAVHAFKATCRMAFELSSPPNVLFGALAIEMVFVLPRPKLPKKLGTHRLPHAKRPDFDNLEKSVVDALTGLAWNDDAQLCDVRTMKWVAAADEVPHVEITIRRLDP
jgi:Holliday junction resolvase RusA-like endonuclease